MCVNLFLAVLQLGSAMGLVWKRVSPSSIEKPAHFVKHTADGCGALQGAESIFNAPFPLDIAKSEYACRSHKNRPNHNGFK